MSRIANKFEQLKAEKRAALVTYIMTCDPTPEISQDIFNMLPLAGADIIELGMAFSDPTADGPTIQEAAIRGLHAGATLMKTIQMVKEFRIKDDSTPIILMGYYNPILKYGAQKFCRDAVAAGVDGLIIVDLPIEEEEEFTPFTQEYGLSLIKLVAPTTDAERLPKVLQSASGFVYYISMAGITGARAVNPNIVVGYVNNIKKHTELPVAVGFGVKTPEHAKAIGKYADGVIVGSAIVNKVAEYYPNIEHKQAVSNLKDDIYSFVRSFATALKR